MLKIMRKGHGPANGISALQDEIANLGERVTELERLQKDNREQHDQARARRRDLLSVAMVDVESAELAEANGVIVRTASRIADLADAIAAVRQQEAAASAKLAAERDREARRAESARIDQLIKAAINAAKELDSALSGFSAAYAPLTMSGELAATSANAFRERVAMFVADALASTREYRTEIANGARPLPAAVLAAQNKTTRPEETRERG